MSEWFSLEDRNYQNDIRIRSIEERWWTEIDENKMYARHKYDTEDGQQVWYPFKYETCHLCNGKGSHVNPSIDCGGLTFEDMYDDGFRDDYLSGMYDQPCNLCKGMRVIPIMKGRRKLKKVDNNE
jgi:DnaJ-class molecular chaperone